MENISKTMALNIYKDPNVMDFFLLVKTASKRKFISILICSKSFAKFLLGHMKRFQTSTHPLLKMKSKHIQMINVFNKSYVQ